MLFNTATKTIPSRLGRRHLTSTASPHIKIVEVGPRDGLQNEKNMIPTAVKIDLINKLQGTGLPVIEVGSFVSPKWVPQMAGTTEVLLGINHKSGVHYPVLVPNAKGLDNLLDLFSSSGRTRENLTDEIAIFVAASESFSRANINCSINESIQRLGPAVQRAREAGLRVRGYVSTVISCPFEGPIQPGKVRDVAKALDSLGCYEISLGDTIGTGTPQSVETMLNEVVRAVPVGKLAAHMHDTYGMAVSNCLTAVNAGVRTIDSSVAGLGGCPYAPGATGNVATEDVVYALHEMGYTTGVDLTELAKTGRWISKELNRPNASRVGRAWLARIAREAEEDARAKL